MNDLNYFSDIVNFNALLTSISKNFILTLFCFISYQGMPQSRISLDSILLKGKEYENKRNFDAALDIYKKQLSNGITPKEKSIYLSEIARIHYKMKNYEESKFHYRKSLLTNPSFDLLVKNYIGLSYCFKKTRLKDSSVYYIDKANKINQSLPKSYEKSDSEYKIAFLYSFYGYNEKAMLLFLSGSDDFKKFLEEKKLANIYNEIAFIHRISGNSKVSLEYYHKARYLRQKIQDLKGVSSAYNNLGNGHKSLMQLDSALFYYKKSLKIKQENAYKNQGFTLHNIGTVFYLKKDLPNAKNYYQKALNAKKKEGDKTTLIYSYNELALVAIELNELSLGKVYLDSVNMYKTMDDELTLRVYELQKNLHEKQGNYLKAYQYQEEYINTYKKLYSTKKAKVILDNQEKYENVKKIKRIENLTEENKQRSEALTRTTIYLIGSLILIILLVTLFFINKQRQKLFTQKEDIKNLRKLFQSQDMVRNKIGRDLHDIVKSKYEGIRLMIISLNKSANIANDIKEITQEIVDANEQVRMLSHRLSPLDQRIRHSTLNQIIRSELNKFQLYTNIKVNIENNFPKKWNTMKLEQQNHLYGIFLEAIHNIRDHSNASEILITSSIIRGHCKTIISDNGLGKSAPFKEGIGIGNMKSRAKLMNGNLNITSSIQGFSVVLEFPLNNINDEI